MPMNGISAYDAFAFAGIAIVLVFLSFVLTRKLALHWRILIGMAAGVTLGLICAWYEWNPLLSHWITPFGVMFVNALKLIAVPLIIASLVKGIAELRDISSFSRMGWRTIALYLCTTVIAVTIGLLIANIVRPGSGFTEETRQKLMTDESNVQRAETAGRTAEAQSAKGPLQPLVDLIPENIFFAAGDNRNMLQVIFFTIFFAISLILIEPARSEPVRQFFSGLNDVILRMIDLLMLAAPIGVFALLATQVAETPTPDVLVALLKYSLCVVGGLAFMLFVFYPALVVLFAKRPYGFFMRGIAPAQLLAFSTSSSAATLPVTMERVEEHLGVDNEVTSFVLPVGATVNMDGTSLYQAVAAIFIAQAYAMELSLGEQLEIVVTATLASIGAAAVPGAGIVMLVIVLGAIDVPVEGLALILAVDRILDMCRTTVNVTGDAVVSMLVAKSVGKLGAPPVVKPQKGILPEPSSAD
jgi:Na+/H+-dicarboxylate symporter